MHLSINSPEGENLVGDKSRPSEMTETAEKFVAGILNNYNSLVALTCAQPISYERF